MEIHRRLIDRFGGTQGARDLGLLDSALHRPQSGYYENLTDMAAALLESLLLNHAFIDGNKRAAFFIADVFLRMNGYKFRIGAKEAERFLISYVGSRERKISDISGWIQTHLHKI